MYFSDEGPHPYNSLGCTQTGQINFLVQSVEGPGESTEEKSPDQPHPHTQQKIPEGGERTATACADQATEHEPRRSTDEGPGPEMTLFREDDLRDRIDNEGYGPRPAEKMERVTPEGIDFKDRDSVPGRGDENQRLIR